MFHQLFNGFNFFSQPINQWGLSCAAVSNKVSQNGLWNDVACSPAAVQFVCEKFSGTHVHCTLPADTIKYFFVCEKLAGKHVHYSAAAIGTDRYPTRGTQRHPRHIEWMHGTRYCAMPCRGIRASFSLSHACRRF